MKENELEKALDRLPLHRMLFCGEGSTSATTHRKGGIITIPLSKVPELERLVAEKAASPDDPENSLAIAFSLHLKGGDAIQKDSRSYHYSRICWSLFMKAAGRLRSYPELLRNLQQFRLTTP